MTRQNKKNGTTVIYIFLHSSAAFFSHAIVHVYVVYSIYTENCGPRIQLASRNTTIRSNIIHPYKQYSNIKLELECKKSHHPSYTCKQPWSLIKQIPVPLIALVWHNVTWYWSFQLWQYNFFFNIKRCEKERENN